MYKEKKVISEKFCIFAALLASMETHSPKQTFLKLAYELWICLLPILVALVVYFQVGAQVMADRYTFVV